MPTKKNRYAKDDMQSQYPGKSSREYNAQRKRYDQKKLTLQEYVDKWGSAPKKTLRKKK